MTVIAWDGRYLAVDKQGTYGECAYTTMKSKQLPNGIAMAFCGNTSYGLAQMAWYEDGADPAKYPPVPAGEGNNATFIVAAPGGEVLYFQDTHHPIRVDDKVRGFGYGSGFVLGAMLAGASAESAVRLACEWVDGCGKGVDVYDVNPPADDSVPF